MKLYLAGPAHGHPRYYAPLFQRTAAMLRLEEHAVFFPLEQPICKALAAAGGALEEAAVEYDAARILLLGLEWICEEAEGVVALPDWRGFRSSRAEVAAADALNLPVWPAAEFLLRGREATAVTS
ncbi:DUF4406 domain-containing protein [Actinomadura nitritigenes]|uniref:DUF4406 domain-containing protein n=1 Tax=Actinomadura nitritigenes TaxID=134602 RepID=UPI003D9183A1